MRVDALVRRVMRGTVPYAFRGTSLTLGPTGSRDPLELQPAAEVARAARNQSLVGLLPGTG